MTDLVESAMFAPIDNSALAQRQALVKNACEKASSSIESMVHA
jgi:hypothetical protein